MLTIEQLCVTAGAFQVRDVSMQVADGEYFVVMGPTGSGKSLVIKAVCGLIPVASGTIILDGEDITWAEPRLRKVGYVPQNSDLFPHLTVERNLTFPLEVAGESLADARRGIEKIVDVLALAPLLERSVTTLSGGERQKVALGRALARKPRLLLLDEPVSALDDPSRRDVSRTLLETRKAFGIMTMHVCHNTEEAKILADRLGVFRAGRLVRVGSYAELVGDGSESVLAKLFGE